jgi:hypothetical protein
MAKNAIHILKDENVLNIFKMNAYEQAKKFDLNKILPMYEKLYEVVLSKNKKSTVVEKL